MGAIRCIIVQHADALPEDADPERSLSAVGIAQSHRAARFLCSLAVAPGRIIHSGKKRARQTAEILADALGEVSLETRPYLNPNDDPSALIEELRTSTETLMIVGHMPFLRRLAIALLALPDDGLIAFTNASPLVLLRDGGRYRIEAYAKNDLLA